MFQTWEEFNQGVRGFLPVDDKRCGVQTFIDQHIRAALINMMQKIPCLRINMETTYTEDNVKHDGTASVGHMPPCGQTFEARFIVNEKVCATETSDNCSCESGGQNVALLNARQTMTPKRARWASRHQMVAQGDYDLHPKLSRSYLAISPDAQHFYSFPQLKKDRVELLLIWQKDYPDWQDDEITTLGEKEQLAVADWVKAKLAIQMGEKMEHATFMDSFTEQRRQIWRDCNRRKDLGDYQNYE
jgi:hypothetical protein